MADLSAVIITLNEETDIAGCIESVSWCKEILVVDSGSSDRTVQIAESLGARVLHHDFSGFGAQKQFGADSAMCDWILSIDADERVCPKLRSCIHPSHCMFCTLPSGCKLASDRNGEEKTAVCVILHRFDIP